MKSSVRKIQSLVLVFVLILATVVTSLPVSAKTKSVKVKEISIENVSTGKLTLYKGQSYDLGTTVSPGNATKKKVTYSVSKKNIVSVSSKGKVKGLKTGTVYVTAKATDNSKKKTKIKVTVIEKKKYKKITKITPKQKKITMLTGESRTIGVTLKPSKASNKNLSFSSGNKKVATVTNKGEVKAKAAGTAKITIKALDGSKKKATVTVKVEAPVLAESVSLNQTSMSMEVGDTNKLVATVMPENTTNKEVVWTSSNTSVVSVDENGIVAAYSEGTAIVTAATQDGSEKTASVSITVTKKEIKAASVEIRIDGESADGVAINQGMTRQLEAVVSPKNTTDAVIWESANPSIATVDSEGKVTGIVSGTTDIKVKCGEKEDVCHVKVNGKIQITFDSQGGSQIQPITAYEGSTIQQPIPNRSGYIFKGWYKDSACTNLFDFSQALSGGDFTLYAKWEEEYLHISVDSETTGTVTDVRQIVKGTFETNGNVTSISFTLKDGENSENVKQTGAAVIGSGEWEINDLLLSPGDNKLEIKAVTNAQTEANVSAIINYDRGELGEKPSVDDISGISMSDNTITVTENATPYVKNRLLLYFNEDVSQSRMESIANEVGTKLGNLNTVRLYQVQLNTACDTEDAILQKAEEVLESYSDELAAVEPEWVVVEEKNLDVNDPWNGASWNEDSPADENWWAEAVGAQTAWSYMDQLDTVRVGIVDNGFDTAHEDLTINFSNSDRRSENSVEEHGTHVAGIVGATADNGKGITGLAYNSTLYGYDWQPGEGQNWNTSTKIQDLYIEAIEDGCKVVNLSLGKSGNLSSDSDGFDSKRIDSWGKSTSTTLGKLLERGYDFVIVQSAGNGASNGVGVDAVNNGLFASITDDNCYSSNMVEKEDILSRILIVAAAEQKDGSYQLTSFSNGGGTVNIAAPGRDIYSTLPNSTYGKKSGTSMAAPIVAASAALVWSVNDNFTGEEITEILKTETNATASDNTVSGNTTGSYPMVNAGLAVKEAVSRGGVVTGYFSDAVTGDSIKASYVIHKKDDNGAVVGNGSSDDEGYFTISGLKAGRYVLKISAEGYVENTATIMVPLRGEAYIGAVALTKEIDPNSYRIVLTWENEPSDLDSHLRAINSSGEDVHIYYANRVHDEGNLDRDDTDYEGPETITITAFSQLSDVRYAVHNYSDAYCDSDDADALNLSNSGAVVKVYKGTSLLKTYEVPKNIKGTVWNVFSIDSAGQIWDINSMSYQKDSSEVLMNNVQGTNMLYYATKSRLTVVDKELLSQEEKKAIAK